MTARDDALAAFDLLMSDEGDASENMDAVRRFINRAALAPDLPADLAAALARVEEESDGLDEGIEAALSTMRSAFAELAALRAAPRLTAEEAALALDVIGWNEDHERHARDTPEKVELRAALRAITEQATT